MDDGGPGTSFTGTWENVRKKKNALNDFYQRSESNGYTYRWTPPGLVAADYEVWAWWPKTNKNNPTAQYSIVHNGQTDISVQNQATPGKMWILMGTYEFSGTGSEYIEISDLGGKTAADGIQLIEIIQDPPVIATGLYYIHNDHLGTPQVITDQSQTVAWQADYEPFGETSVTTNTIANNLRFPGQYCDEESGLHQNYFRDYDPGLGRYVQSDPIGLRGGLNTYAYVESNPLSYSDQLGLLKLSLGWTGTIFSGGVGGNVGTFVGVDTKGQFCAQVRTCALGGAGLDGGTGVSTRVGSGEFCEGESVEGGFFGEGGFGPFGAVAVTTGGDGFNITGTLGGGSGAAGGGQVCIIKTVCF